MKLRKSQSTGPQRHKNGGCGKRVNQLFPFLMRAEVNSLTLFPGNLIKVGMPPRWGGNFVYAKNDLWGWENPKDLTGNPYLGFLKCSVPCVCNSSTHIGFHFLN
jgi:hypothetical protein